MDSLLTTIRCFRRSSRERRSSPRTSAGPTRFAWGRKGTRTGISEGSRGQENAHTYPKVYHGFCRFFCGCYSHLISRGCRGGAIYGPVPLKSAWATLSSAGCAQERSLDGAELGSSSGGRAIISLRSEKKWRRHSAKRSGSPHVRPPPGHLANL